MPRRVGVSAEPDHALSIIGISRHPRHGALLFRAPVTLLVVVVRPRTLASPHHADNKMRPANVAPMPGV